MEVIISNLKEITNTIGMFADADIKLNLTEEQMKYMIEKIRLD
jgi:hypothetical protein